MRTKSNLPLLAGLFFIIWTALAINPHFRSDWALENALVMVTVIVVFFSYKKQPLSNTSYWLLFVFLLLHIIGAHFTYAATPYETFFGYFNFSLNDFLGWERNNYDRLVHFSYGLLLSLIIVELAKRNPTTSFSLAALVSLMFIMASSMVFELFEWIAAEVFNPELGAAYLGAQGDIWDAQKDMALATLGSMITLGIMKIRQ